MMNQAVTQESQEATIQLDADTCPACGEAIADTVPCCRSCYELELGGEHDTLENLGLYGVWP